MPRHLSHGPPAMFCARTHTHTRTRTLCLNSTDIFPRPTEFITLDGRKNSQYKLAHAKTLRLHWRSVECCHIIKPAGHADGKYIIWGTHLGLTLFRVVFKAPASGPDCISNSLLEVVCTFTAHSTRTASRLAVEQPCRAAVLLFVPFAVATAAGIFMFVLSQQRQTAFRAAAAGAADYDAHSRVGASVAPVTSGSCCRFSAVSYLINAPGNCYLSAERASEPNRSNRRPCRSN